MGRGPEEESPLGSALWIPLVCSSYFEYKVDSSILRCNVCHFIPSGHLSFYTLLIPMWPVPYALGWSSLTGPLHPPWTRESLPTNVFDFWHSLPSLALVSICLSLYLLSLIKVITLINLITLIITRVEENDKDNRNTIIRVLNERRIIK